MVVRLRPMTKQEFQRWQEASIRSYATEHVKTGRWSEEESIERARKQFKELLPNGLATEGQHLYSIPLGLIPRPLGRFCLERLLIPRPLAAG